jgi:hypothetical protein
MALILNDVASLKTIKYGAIKTTGTLIQWARKVYAATLV